MKGRRRVPRTPFVFLAVLGLAARASAQTAPAPCSPDGTGTVEIEGPGPKATIELEGPPPDLTLMRHVPPYGWRSVCQAPCKAIAPAGGEYKLRGSGMTESDLFRVDPTTGSKLRVRVAPVSQSALIAGTILIYAGVSVIPSGALAVASGYVTDEDGLVIVGFVTMGIGAVMTGIGLPLFLANSKSDVVVERIARPGETSSPDRRSLASGRHERRFALPLVSSAF